MRTSEKIVLGVFAAVGFVCGLLFVSVGHLVSPAGLGLAVFQALLLTLIPFIAASVVNRIVSREWLGLVGFLVILAATIAGGLTHSQMPPRAAVALVQRAT